jgi:hypothetical protein
VQNAARKQASALADEEAWHFCAALHEGLRENERLACVGSTSEMGAWDVDGARVMDRASDAVWATLLKVPDQELEYKYVVVTDPEFEGSVDGNRLLDMSRGAPEAFTVIDRLGSGVRGLAATSEQPLEVLERHGPNLGVCRFELMADDLEDYSHVSVVGAHAALGAWRPEDGLPLVRDADSNVWAGVASLPLGEDVHFKFVVWRSATVDAAARQHRRLHIPEVASCPSFAGPHGMSLCCRLAFAGHE